MQTLTFTCEVRLGEQQEATEWSTISIQEKSQSLSSSDIPPSTIWLNQAAERPMGGRSSTGECDAAAGTSVSSFVKLVDFVVESRDGRKWKGGYENGLRHVNRRTTAVD